LNMGLTLSINVSRAVLNVKYFKASRSDVTLHHTVFIQDAFT
jgi:hypothetical protein